MSQQSHDSPYRDAPAPKAAPSRDTSPRPARQSRQSRSTRPETRPAPTPPAAPAARKRSSRRGRKGGGEPNAASQLTSHPTGRAAYMDTRVWLLKQHGPVCAYCDRRFTAGVMTLDHVAPRKGQTAYDRRDNLVLSCPGCNTAKRDMAPLAFLLAARSRAAALLKYGAHLSPMLLDMVRSLVATDTARAEAIAEAAGANGDAPVKAPTDWGQDFGDLDGESPYKD